MKRLNVSIIIPKYKPNKVILGLLRDYLKKSARGMEVIEVDGKKGLANAYNKGINKSKGEIIITIHQDCVPNEKDSITKLIEPFKDNSVVMTYSRIIDLETKKDYLPYPPDGKFVAYRKNSLINVGLFDEKTFFTGGEDVDLWLKLKKIGKVLNVNTSVTHFHKGYLGNKNLEKRRQNGSINGALFRVWYFKNPKWIKALIFCFIYPFSYGTNFVKAFISKKQEYRRRDET